MGASDLGLSFLVGALVLGKSLWRREVAALP